MRRLIADQTHAARLGENARAVARARFGLDRFARDWNAAFAQAAELCSRPATTRETEPGACEPTAAPARR
jgi:hypothetical protein